MDSICHSIHINPDISWNSHYPNGYGSRPGNTGLGRFSSPCSHHSADFIIGLLSLELHPLSGLFAAIITGFITPMPAYYTSWGRYTELTGLLILPAAFTLVLLLMEVNKSRRKFLIVFLSAITLGGLFLVLYLVTVFLGCLFVSYFVIFMVIKK